MRALHDRRIATTVLASILVAALAPAAWCAWPHDPYVNVRIAPSAGNQMAARMAADGQGGFYATWTESRIGYSTVYLQHIGADGQIVPGWPTDGLAATTQMTSHQWYPSIAADAGGVYVAWEDERNGGPSSSDIYVQRVTPTGSLAPGWPAAGLRLGTYAADENRPVCADDGAGSLYVLWEYVFSTGPPSDIDLYGAYVHANTAVAFVGAIDAPGWDQTEPVIAPDGSGGFTGVYRDNTGGTAFYTLMAVHYGAGFTYGWKTTVSNGGGDQQAQQLVADGTGGYVVAWVDTRGGTDDIYATRLTAAGQPMSGWSTNGIPVCSASGAQDQVQLCPDGSGGAFFAWRDGRNDTGDLYACRLAGSGAIGQGWSPNGTVVAAYTSAQFNPAVAADGAGGAYIVWMDLRPNFSGCYGVRYAVNGSLLPGWSYGGTMIGRVSLGTSRPLVVGDGGTGALAMFDDHRTSSNQLYAQRVDRFGALGNPEPVLEQVRDVSADQGGRVRLDWAASYLDQEAFPNIDSYWIWRQVPAGLAASRVAEGGEWLDDWLASARLQAGASAAAALPEAPAAGVYLRDADATATYSWEYVTSQPASAFPSYSYTAATTTDSIAGSNPYTVFMVQARGSSYGTFWNSAPDSGYSVDNLAPATPSPATWTWSSGTAFLHWGANTEADLAGYRLYRGSTAGFVPSAGNLISAQPDTGFVDGIGTPLYYKLSAVDVHGNESGYALLAPGGLTAVDPGATPTVLSFAPPAPNPTGGPVSLRFTLPREGPVRLQVFDPAGRVVREFRAASVGPGEHAITWDGRGAGGHALPAGLYVIRLEAEGRALVRRTVRLGGR